MTTPLNETATLRDLLFGDEPGTPIDALTAEQGLTDELAI